MDYDRLSDRCDRSDRRRNVRVVRAVVGAGPSTAQIQPVKQSFSAVS